MSPTEAAILARVNDLTVALAAYSKQNPRVEEHGYTPEGPAQDLARDIARAILEAVEVKTLGGCPLCQS